jgi:hypothetical protein
MMPMLSAVYGLRWEHIESMPAGERREYVIQLAEVQRRMAQFEMVSFNGA